MPKKGTILTPEQKAKKKINDKKYCEANKEKRKALGRAQYLKDKGDGMRWVNRRRVWTTPVILKITEGSFVLAFD
jgi:hypothetical protein